jgi:hypothetical protein
MSLGTLVLGFEGQIWFQSEHKTSFNKSNHKLFCLFANIGFNINFLFAIFARAPCRSRDVCQNECNLAFDNKRKCLALQN